MKKLIKVTQEDIENGLQNMTLYCPVAVALKRHNPKFNYYVSNKSVKIENSYIRFKPLPRSAQRFISNFDKNKKVKPFNFFIQIP